MKNQQDTDKQLGMMQESMLKMHEKMHAITDAKTSQDRDRLTQEHRHMIQKHMQAMKDSGMMGGDAKSNSDTHTGTHTGKEHKYGEKHN